MTPSHARTFGLLTLVAGLGGGACAPEDSLTYEPFPRYFGFVSGEASKSALTVEAYRYDEATDDDVAIKDAEYTLSNPSVATLEREGATARLVPKTSGELVLTIGKGVEPQRLVFTEYTKAEWEAGRARYETGRSDAAGVACKTCHAAGLIADGVHKRGLSSYSEGEILRAAQMGETEWGLVNEGNHRWNLTAEERRGVVAYIRSLAEARTVDLYEN